MKWYQLDKKNTINYFLLLFFSFLYTLPTILILNNLYLNDDLGWSLGRSVGFKGDGRPLLEYLVLALCGGEPIVDIFPIPLVLGILFLSYTLILYAQTNLNFISNRCALLAELLLIITNPFLVECASYRYGSMGVLISLGMPFIIFSMPDTLSKIKTFIYSLLLTIALFSLQQAAIGLCLILFMTNIFFLLFQDKKLNYICEGLRIAGIGIGAIIYKAIIAPHYVASTDWRHQASQTLEIKSESIIIIFQNIIDTCKFIMRALSETVWWYQLALVLIVIFTIVLSIILYCWDTPKKGWRRVLDISFLILSPILVFVFSFLALMILKEQTLKFRIFTTHGGILLYLGIVLLHFVKKHPALIHPILLLFIVCNFYHYTYISSYANAVNSQNEYAKYIVYNVAHDIETINANGEFSDITFIGKMPQPKRTQVFSAKYPMTGDLLPRYFTNDGWIGGAYVLHYLQDDLSIEKDTDADNEIVKSTEPVIANSIYSCYVNDDKIIVAFHEFEVPN